MKSFSAAVSEEAMKPVLLPYTRDFYKEKSVTDEVFNIYRRQFAYDKGELDPVVESTDESSEYWKKEKISFNAAYGNERVSPAGEEENPLHLFGVFPIPVADLACPFIEGEAFQGQKRTPIRRPPIRRPMSRKKTSTLNSRIIPFCCQWARVTLRTLLRPLFSIKRLHPLLHQPPIWIKAGVAPGTSKCPKKLSVPYHVQRER